MGGLLASREVRFNDRVREFYFAVFRKSYQFNVINYFSKLNNSVFVVRFTLFPSDSLPISDDHKICLDKIR